MEDLEPQDANEDDELEAEIMRTDHAFESESVGTTAEEALEGETLDQRLAEERPERPGTDEVLSVVDEGLSDDEEELVGEAVLERDEFASPEEAAVTERDRADPDDVDRVVEDQRDRLLVPIAWRPPSCLNVAVDHVRRHVRDRVSCSICRGRRRSARGRLHAFSDQRGRRH